MNSVLRQQLLAAAQTLQSALMDSDDQQIQIQLAQLADLSSSVVTPHLPDEMAHPSQPVTELQKILTHTLPDIHDRLSYIKDITHQAAHQTLSITDDASHLITQLEQQTKQCSQTLALNGPDVGLHLAQLQSALNDITTNQHFQDLTGQVIHQITDLIEEVATDLSPLVTMTQKKQSNTPPSNGVDNLKAEGPQINSNKANIVNTQNDVDDLLSSLGL